MTMTAFSEDQINLTVLQRIDPKIIEIEDHASQVALYKFIMDQDQWVDQDIEGSLFIYKRSEIPFHGFMIMNRMNTTNLVEPFVRGLEFKKQEPYLMYKNESGTIYCTWFYEQKDYVRVSKCIQRIIHAKKGKAISGRKRSSSESASTFNLCNGFVDNPCNGITQEDDVISLLTQAQHEYDKQNGKHTAPWYDKLSAEFKNDSTPLSSETKLTMPTDPSFKQSSIGKELNPASRRRCSSGHETMPVITDEDVTGQPTFLVDRGTPKQGETSLSSHCVADDDVLVQSPVYNGVQTRSNNNIPVPKPHTKNAPPIEQCDHIKDILLKTGFRTISNCLINGHDSTKLRTHHVTIEREEHYFANSPPNPDEKISEDGFMDNGLPSSSQVQDVPNGVCPPESDVMAKQRAKVLASDDDSITDLKFHDHCTDEEVKHSLFQLFQFESSLVGKIHNAYKLVQGYNRRPRMRVVDANQEIHV